MAKERGVIRMILTNFINSFKPKNFSSGTLVGKDQFGNQYFEIPTSANRRKASRWFVPKSKDDFESEMPAEWESWLRGRRRTVPTAEEVMGNAAIAELKKVNAAKLEAEDPTSKPPPIKEGVTAFPKYDDYELFPGKKNPPNK